MWIDTYVPFRWMASTHGPVTVGLVVALGLVLVVIGCDSTDASSDVDDRDVAAVAIWPDSASIAVGEQVDFSAAALTAEGDTVRDVALEWESTDADVFTVTDDGVATGEGVGTAFCTVKLRAFTGRDSAFVAVF